MKSIANSNRQDGFLELGAGLLILALFGGTAAVITTDDINKVYAQQETIEPAMNVVSRED